MVDQDNKKILRLFFDLDDAQIIYDLDEIIDLGNSYNWGDAFKIPTGLNQVQCS